MIALLCGSGERLLTAPGLDDNVLGRAGNENFVPAYDRFAVLGDDFLEALTEIYLEFFVGFQIVRFFEFLDFWIGVPLLAVHFIAANVEIVVGEKFDHLSYQVVEKLIGFFVRRIHRGIEDSPLAFDGVRAGAAGKFGITDKPGGAVTGHIELRNDADAAIAGVGDEFANFILRVVEAV